MLTVIGVFALHQLLDVNYPVRRTAMHLPFLMLLSVFTILDDSPRLLRMGAGGIIASFLAFNFVSQANVNHVLDWRYECVPRTFVERIAQFQDSTGAKPIVSCNNFMNYLIGLQMPSVNGNFYSERSQSFPSVKADLLIATENMKWDGLVYFDTIDFNHQTDMTLMQRKELTHWTVVHEDHLPLSKPSTTPCLFRVDSVEHLIGKPMAIEIDIVASAPTSPVIWSIYAQVWSSESESTFSGNIDLGATHYDLREPRNVNIRSEFTTLQAGSDHIRIFMISSNNKPFTLSQARVTLLAEETE